MTCSTTQAPSDSEGAHLVLYDGACGLCSRFVQFVLDHDPRAVFHFAPLQSATAKAMVIRGGGNPEELTSLYVFANFRTQEARVLTRSDAALFVADELGCPWKVVVPLRVLPAAILDFIYDVVARSRYVVFGRREQCLVPRPEFASRFVE
jgi:predicted DCC family thiol-disulfide oxidoreductase YuxK